MARRSGELERTSLNERPTVERGMARNRMPSTMTTTMKNLPRHVAGYTLGSSATAGVTVTTMNLGESEARALRWALERHALRGGPAWMWVSLAPKDRGRR